MNVDQQDFARGQQLKSLGSTRGGSISPGGSTRGGSIGPTTSTSRGGTVGRQSVTTSRGGTSVQPTVSPSTSVRPSAGRPPAPSPPRTVSSATPTASSPSLSVRPTIPSFSTYETQRRAAASSPLIVQPNTYVPQPVIVQPSGRPPAGRPSASSTGQNISLPSTQVNPQTPSAPAWPTQPAPTPSYPTPSYAPVPSGRPIATLPVAPAQTAGMGDPVTLLKENWEVAAAVAGLFLLAKVVAIKKPASKSRGRKK